MVYFLMANKKFVGASNYNFLSCHDKFMHKLTPILENIKVSNFENKVTTQPCYQTSQWL